MTTHQKIPLAPDVETSEPASDHHQTIPDVETSEPASDHHQTISVRAADVTTSRRWTPLDREQIDQIKRLKQMGFGTRKIAKKTGLGRKVVRNVLSKHGLLPGSITPSSSNGHSRTSKLEPYRRVIMEKARKGLTISRILREIHTLGYTGERTILADHLRSLNLGSTPQARKVKKRFETKPGEETQVDWSPYRVPVGGRICTVHAFLAMLGFSRKAHVQFYENERESTLLEAHTHAFHDFGGVTLKIVYDRMATVVLGTIGSDRKPLWHPRFKEFAEHYGFSPFLCKPRDPDRKGKGERFFWYLEQDFIRGSSFESMEALNDAVRVWLDEQANCRIHGTTRHVPDEQWAKELPYLIQLPQARFPDHDEQMRSVGKDAVISVRGTPYTIPAELANQNVCVRLYSDHFEVLDQRGQEVWSRRYVPHSQKGQLQCEEEHYDCIPRHSPLHGTSTDKLQDALLCRFPQLDEFLAGIRLKMKGLSHVYLRDLWRLADQYGDTALSDAACRAQEVKRFNSHTVRRILEREHPLPPQREPITALHNAARVLLQLGEVDSGSLDDYAHLDTIEPDNNEDDAQ